MTEIPRTVFRVERSDDALVVVPTAITSASNCIRSRRRPSAPVADVNSSVLSGVIFDAGETSYLSSTVIGAMIRLWEAAKAHRAKFVLCCLSDDAMAAIVATRLDTNSGRVTKRERRRRRRRKTQASPLAPGGLLR